MKDSAPRVHPRERPPRILAWLPLRPSSQPAHRRGSIAGADPSAAMPARHLYVLPLFCEDRQDRDLGGSAGAVRSFSARYYEGFDLARSAVVRFEDGGDARRLETALHRRLRQWNAPAPLTVATAAGGATEWYRGAMPQVLDAVAEEAGRGHAVWAPALDWWRERLRGEEPLLYEWAEACLREVAADEPLAPQAWTRIADVLDAGPRSGLVVHATTGDGPALPDLPPRVRRAGARVGR